MNILLLTQPWRITKEVENNYSFYPPLGLLYIAAVLEKDGHTIKILDCLAEGFDKRVALNDGTVYIGLPKEEITGEIAKFKPQIICIGCGLTAFAEEALQLAQWAKETSPESTIVLGGAHASMAYQEIISKPFVDVVMRGEAEYTLSQLAKTIEQNHQQTNIDGLVIKNKEGNIVTNPPAKPIQDLDTVPFPAYHLINMDFYLKIKTNNFAYCKNFPVAHMITSRGCMYNCIFCSTTKFFQKYRSRSAENVLGEIELLTKKYGVKEIHFHDDSFLCDKKMVHKLCQGLIDRNIKISWQVSQGMTVWNLDIDTLRLMHKSGMYRMGLPIESGSEKTLKYMRKPVNLKHALEVIRESQRLGVYTHGNFIIGFPYETKEEIEETANFVYQSGLDFVKMLVCQPHKGADLYDVYVKEGLLQTADDTVSNYENTKYNTKYFTADQLNTMRDEITRKFFKKKIKTMVTPKGFTTTILPKINSYDKIKYFTRLFLISAKRFVSGKNVFGI